MGIRKLKPTTPGQGYKVIGTFDKITAGTPGKSLIVGKKSIGGRNNTGKMIMCYIGGGYKQKYRIINFKGNKDGTPAAVKSIEYNPNRSPRIALLHYVDGAKSYITAPNGLEVGQTVVSGSDTAPKVGSTLPTANIPVGTIIHNIELRPEQGAKMVRSTGAFAQLTSKEGVYTIIEMPSGETRKILAACRATTGAIGSSDHVLEKSSKVSRSRWSSRRPRNRGVITSPADHPVGGGEGCSSGGRPRSRNGLYAKGLKTRAPKRHSSKYIIERRKR